MDINFRRDAGGYLANLETLDEAMFLMNIVAEMKTGNSFKFDIIIQEIIQNN